MVEGSSNKIIIITAPSGAGKTSITHHLLKTFPNRLSFSVSAATRMQRENEVNGKDYHFMSLEEFQEKIQHEEFIEWEMVYEGKYYGTLKSEIKKLWEKGITPLLDIDVKGAIHVQQQFPNSSLSIFIEAPSIDELKRRLESRGTESPETLHARISKADYELSFKTHFNKVIVNDNLERACTEAEEIVKNFLSDL
jgi:guanylate kinase